MANAKVSVVIPSYNSGDTIDAAIDSALLQSVPVEVIVVDDGSKDDTEQVLLKYKNDSRVRIILNDTNMGVAESRNRGVKAAVCDKVAFLDSDDMWTKDKLKKQLELMERNDAVICSTARELLKENGERTGKIIEVPETVTYRQLLRGNVINCSSVVADRHILLKYPMGNDDIHEDYICWLQILKDGGNAVLINEPLLLYRVVKNSKSGSKLSSAKKTFAVYRKLGYGFFRSCLYFVNYAVNGVKKYFL